MSVYALSYDCPEGYPEMDQFEGDWFELQDFIKSLRNQGCTNIYAACISEEV